VLVSVLLSLSSLSDEVVDDEVLPAIVIYIFLANIVHKMMKDDGIMTTLYKRSPVVMATLARLAVHAWQSSSNG